MNCRMYYLVVVDDSSPFNEIFSSICKSLNIKLNMLAKHDHKDLTIKRFRCFLNKVFIIAANDRVTLNVFVSIGIIADYTWKITLIDGTEIIRSIVPISRELHSSLDIKISALPDLSYNKS